MATLDMVEDMVAREFRQVLSLQQGSPLTNSHSYCIYYPYYPGCSGGGGYNPYGNNPYLCYYYPQYCGGGGGGGYYPYPNPYGVKPFDGKTSCGDLGDSDDKDYG